MGKKVESSDDEGFRDKELAGSSRDKTQKKVVSSDEEQGLAGRRPLASSKVAAPHPAALSKVDDGMTTGFPSASSKGGGSGGLPPMWSSSKAGEGFVTRSYTPSSPSHLKR